LIPHLLFALLALVVFAVSSCGKGLNTGRVVSDDDGIPSIPWLVHFGAVTKAPGGSNASLELCNSVTADSSGYVYCAGYANGGFAEANGGGNDGVVVKLSPSGSLVWAKQLGAVTKAAGLGNSANQEFRQVVVDASGNVYAAGNTQGSTGEGSGGSDDAFVVKLSSSGELQWVKQLGASTVSAGGSNAGLDKCLAVAVDSSGSVYCTGFTSGAMGEANGGGNDLIVFKLGSDGTLQWLKQLGATTVAPGGSNSGSDLGRGIALDGVGGVYVVGHTTGAMAEASGGSSDVFVSKFSASSGALQWLKQLGAVTLPSGSGGGDEGLALSLGDLDTIYVSGSTTGAMGEANAGSSDGFVARFSASTGSLQWIKQLGAVTRASGGDNIGHETCQGVGVDGSGNVYLGGYTTGAVGEAFGGGVYDAFVAKFTSTGALISVKQFGAATPFPNGLSNAETEYLYGMHVDRRGRIYLTGFTNGSLGEANGGSLSADIYVAKVIQ
jgi:hypothetical protein